MLKIALALTLALCVPSCSWFSAKASASEKAFVSCAGKDLTANAAGIAGSVLEEVTKILTQGSAGWQTDLDSVGSKVGADVLACAVETIREVFLMQADVAQSAAGSGAKSVAEENPAISRADQYLSAKGVQFAPAK